MDILTPILICLFVFFMCSLCGYCCRRKQQGAIFSTPVIVTSTTTTSAPGGYPVTVHNAPPGVQVQPTPYQNVTSMPMPQPQMVANPPYPSHGGGMPQPYGGPQGYPPYPTVDPNRMNPPSYDQVISAEGTQKQAPYNPNYMGN